MKNNHRQYHHNKNQPNQNHQSKIIAVVYLSAFFVFNNQAISSEPSFKEVPCSAFADEDDLMTFAFWLDGYITGAQQKPIFDQEAIELLLEITLTSCQNNPEKAVFQIVSNLKSS
ncbi:hypothetical protein WH96_17705 [Kiloniella spongiae]|uniref:Rap1a immunity protein domain-containing protein n=2 Tax=Kiloniella spongiae TaxID=1489064 RepID=A0A0H2M9W8_9PROT|nr:hypothetical protein WH96_17705 [Kiloniella spongiae]